MRKMTSMKKKKRTPRKISKEYYDSIMDAAHYVDYCLSELDGDRYDCASVLTEARLMVLGIERGE